MTNATAAHIADCIIREANMLAAKRAARAADLAAQKAADLAAFRAAQTFEAALHDDRWVTMPSGARVRRIENYYAPIVPTVQDPNAAPIPW